MFGNLKYTLLAALLCLATANAATIAVLEITVVNDEMDLTIDETKFLTDELRRQATQLLQKEHSVLTREKIIALTPQNTKNLTSVIDIGAAIKSDYVTRSFIGKLDNLFTLTVELYETSSGDLLGDFAKESTDLKGLLDAIRENSPSLFAKITQREKLNKGKISANVSGETKTSFWVAIGLDVLGATAIGLGIYNNSKASDYHKESETLLNEKPAGQGEYQGNKRAFDAKYKKFENAEKMRNNRWRIIGRRHRGAYLVLIHHTPMTLSHFFYILR